MVEFIGRAKQQSNEVLDRNISLVDFFSNRTDSPQSVTAVAIAGLTTTPVLNGLNINVTNSGGVPGTTYDVALLLTTTSGKVKEINYKLTIKDIA